MTILIFFVKWLEGNSFFQLIFKLFLILSFFFFDKILHFFFFDVCWRYNYLHGGEEKKKKKPTHETLSPAISNLFDCCFLNINLLIYF